MSISELKNEIQVLVSTINVLKRECEMRENSTIDTFCDIVLNKTAPTQLEYLKQLLLNAKHRFREVRHYD